MGATGSPSEFSIFFADVFRPMESDFFHMHLNPPLLRSPLLLVQFRHLGYSLAHYPEMLRPPWNEFSQVSCHIFKLIQFLLTGRSRLFRERSQLLVFQPDSFSIRLQS